MNFDCPRCRSHNTASFEMAHAGGSHSGYASGTGIDIDGHFGVVGGRFTMNSTLANQTAPPARPKIGFPLGAGIGFSTFMVIFMVVSFIFIKLKLDKDLVGFVLIVSFLIVFPIVLILIKLIINRRSLPNYYNRLRDWNRATICRRCGYQWLRN